VGGDAGVTRRTLLERAALAALAGGLAQLPSLLDAHGLLDEARAQSGDLVVDTFNGLAAFILPGDDAYSVAQGESAPGPGAVGAGVVPPFIAALDEFVPLAALGPGSTLPASGGVASLLNRYATEVAPVAAGGAFPSPFARLSFAQKAEVFRRFEADPAWEGTALRFVGGILPGFIGFMSASEVGVLDPASRATTSRPVSWELSGYAGPAEGHPELRGYWRGHRAAAKSKRVQRWEKAGRRRRRPVRRRRRRAPRRRRKGTG
jgi:hypothetical protein